MALQTIQKQYKHGLTKQNAASLLLVFYVVSKPIVFAVGGGIVGYGGQLILSDDFTGNALIVCKATKEHEQLFRAFSIDMNYKDVWLVSENESDFVVLDGFNVINTNGKWIEYNPALH